MFDAVVAYCHFGKRVTNSNEWLADAPAQDMEEMDNRLNGKTQIWADGYSFLEVTETLLMVLGIRTEDCQPSESEPGRAEPATSSDATPGAEGDR